MAKQTINVGITANDRKGDPLRIAFQKTNSNFTEVYNAIEAINVPSDISSLTDTENLLVEKPYIELSNRIDVVANTIVTFTKPPSTSSSVVFDEIDTDLRLTRDATGIGGAGGGIFNIALETAWDQIVSPLGTEWNLDGWDNLDDVKVRFYEPFREVFRNRIGQNIVGAKLVMHDTINDKYYKFEFSQWQQGADHNGSFAYTRELIDTSVSVGIEYPDGSIQITAPQSFTGYREIFIGDTSQYDIQPKDRGKYINAFNTTVFIPNEETYDFPNGSYVFFVAAGDAPLTLQARDTAVIYGPDGVLTNSWVIPARTTATIIKTDINTWNITAANSNGGSVDFSAITEDIVPATDSTYNLGSAEKQWNSLYVSANTIFVGGTPISVDAGGTLLVDGSPVVGGSNLPYVELTNTPFITQTVTLGEPVTITAEPAGIDARFTTVIGEGGVIDSVTVTTAGTGYVVGQRYQIPSFYVGGVNDDSNVVFFVETVGELGELLTVTVDGFFGPTHQNTPGTYTNGSADYLPSVFDEIDTGVTLTRDNQRGLFNIELEPEWDSNTDDSPKGTLWNSDGWGNLLDLRTRTYTSFQSALDNRVGNNILASELVMYDVANDKYYKFDFSSWGQSNAGGFSYTRSLITDPNYFKKEDYATGNTAIDVIVGDDGTGNGIGITRGNNNSIYNPYREEGYDEETSPAGTLWNTDGWDDLSDIETRTYTNFYDAYNGNLGNRVPGSKAVMYVPDTGKYYAVGWMGWTQGGNGGGFSYTRRELDLTKLNEGIKFQDGTVLKSAEGLSRIKSTAPNGRRIEEAVGYKQVSVTQRVTGESASSTIFDTRTDYYIYVISNEELSAIYNNQIPYTGFEISLDNNTWYQADLVGSNGTWYQVYLIGDRQLSVTAESTVYYRITTGGEAVTWWNKDDLPGGGANFRGAIIDYHAYTGESTIIGTIHIVDDDGEDHITHTEVTGGDTDGENDDLWHVTTEGRIRYRRIDGEAKTLKVHWTAKVFYGSETYD